MALNSDELADKQPAADQAVPAEMSKRRQSDRPRNSKSGVGEPQIGRALRSVYDQTVGEAIPPEMLELLGKLG